MSNFKLGYSTIALIASATANLTASTTRVLANLFSGSRSDRFEIATASTDILTVNYDTATTKTANFLAIMRAKLLHRNDCTGIRLRGSTQSATLPSTLTPTAWFDPNRGVTLVSGAVSQWNDLSGNSYHATQGTAANRPLLSRADANENLSLYSEDLTNAAWTKSYVTASTASILLETAINDFHEANQSIAVITANTYTISVEAKPNGRDWLRLQIGNDAPTGTTVAQWFNVSTGALGTSTGSPVSASITATTDSYYKCSFNFTMIATGNTAFRLVIGNADGSGAYLGDITKGLYLRKSSFRKSTTGSTYVQTTAWPMYAGINGNRSPRSDGTNDTLQATGATSLNVGAGGSVTYFVVFKPLVNATSTLLKLGAAGVSYNWGSDISGLNIRNVNTAGTDAGATTLTLGTTYVYSCVYSGTGNKGYLNGTLEINGARQTTATATNTLGLGADPTTPAVFLNGYISEVIVYNSALSDANRQAVEAYLTTKYLTTPIVQLDTLSTTTLMGPNDEDYFTVFTESAAFRHWWLEFVNEGTASIYACAKVLFGKALDFGREPTAPIEIDMERDAPHSREAGHSVTLNLEAINDTDTQTFTNEVMKYADVFPVVALDPAQTLFKDTKGFHAYVVDHSIEVPNLAENNISITLKEQI